MSVHCPESGSQLLAAWFLMQTCCSDVMCAPPPTPPAPFRLIKHTKQLLEENEEKLCIKVLQTLREMMTKDRGYGEKVPRLTSRQHGVSAGWGQGWKSPLVQACPRKG